MNTIVTSREDILHSSRELIRRQGWEAVNIRSVAAACGVSVGSIYNYFSSKAELVGATVESIWHEIFHFPQEPTAFADTLACVSWLYERMRYGSEKYPGFFTLHAPELWPRKRPTGKQRMYQTWDHVVRRLSAVLRQTPASARTLSRRISRRPVLPRCCSRCCCPRCCGRTTTRAPCWRSFAGPSIQPTRRKHDASNRRNPVRYRLSGLGHHHRRADDPRLQRRAASSGCSAGWRWCWGRATPST